MKNTISMTIALLMLGCSSGGTDTPPVTDNGSTQDLIQVTDEGTEPDVPVVVENCDDVDSKVYRIDTLNVLKPSDSEGVMSGLINALWTNDIETEYLNLIFAVDSYDTETGALVFKGGGAVATDANGVKAGDEGFDSSTSTYSLAPELTYDFFIEVSDCALSSTEPSQIVLLSAKVSVVDSEECADIPGIAIDQIEMTGQMLSNGAGMSQGVLNGVLREEVADCLEAKGLIGAPDNAVNFGWFMKNAGGVAPDHDLDGDGVNDSWIFEAGFSAVAIDNFASCP